MEPCPSCPFRKDANPGMWHPAHILGIAYLGSIRDFEGLPQNGFPTMGCHKFNGVVGPRVVAPPRCGGWLRAAGRTSVSLRMLGNLGMLSQAERSSIEAGPGREVMTPEELAERCGLDMSRIPPLAFDRSRYATPADWARAVADLRDALAEDPEVAWDYVVPGSPLDRGVSDEEVSRVFGSNIAAAIKPQ